MLKDLTVKTVKTQEISKETAARVAETLKRMQEAAKILTKRKA